MSLKAQVQSLQDRILDKIMPVSKKTFDGQVYQLETINGSQEEATRVAERFRKKGHLVRVDDRTGTWHHWYVWTRRKA